MNNPLQALLQSGIIPTSAFPPDSRYFNFPTLNFTRPDGRVITYLKRRLIPPPSDFVTIGVHQVVQGDRLDLLASSFLADPVLYWRICDANAAIAPDDLVKTPGTQINLTLPQGVPGVPNVS